MKLFPDYRFRSLPMRFAAWLFDLSCGLLFPIKFEPSFDRNDIKNILVIRNDHLGDVLMTLPAFFALQRSFPLAQYDFIASEEVMPLLKKIKTIRTLIPFKHHWYSTSPAREIKKNAQEIYKKIKAAHYDLAIDFRGDLRNIRWMQKAKIPFRISYGITGGRFLLTHCPPYPKNLHQTRINLNLLEPLGIKNRPALTPFGYSWDEKNEFLQKIPTAWQNLGVKKMVIHPSAGCPSKIWPYESFVDLIKCIVDQNECKVILIGTDKEKNSSDFSQFSPTNVLDLRGQTNLSDLPILFDYVDLFVGHDSGPAHLAAFQDTPLVILFSGANEASVWRPWSEKMNLLTYSVSCSPCESKICPLHHHHCMKKLSVDDVFYAIRMSLVKYHDGRKKE